jgi:hypothetical protein
MALQMLESCKRSTTGPTDMRTRFVCFGWRELCDTILRLGLVGGGGNVVCCCVRLWKENTTPMRLESGLPLTDPLPSLPLWLCSGDAVSTSDFATLSGFILYGYLREMLSKQLGNALGDVFGTVKAMCFLCPASTNQMAYNMPPVMKRTLSSTEESSIGLYPSMPLRYCRHGQWIRPCSFNPASRHSTAVRSE